MTTNSEVTSHDLNPDKYLNFWTFLNDRRLQARLLERKIEYGPVEKVL